MDVVVEVVVVGPARPPVGSPVLVQIRDTSVADARATILAEARGVVGSASETHAATVTIPLSRAAQGATVRVHIDVDRSGRVSVGDFVSTASHPLTGSGDVHLQVAVRPVV